MILLPLSTVAPLINAYYTKHNGDLLGFLPCSVIESDRQQYERYHSCETTMNVRVVPIFYMDNLAFDSSPDLITPALFFRGCDDGHLGLRFASRDEAMSWLQNCPYNDFAMMISDNEKNRQEGKSYIKFEFHN